MRELQIQCRSCNGTGLYCGFAEPKGTAVVCRNCGGSGAEIIRYEPYTGRKPRVGVSQVVADGGLWFARKGKLETVSLSQFLQDIPQAETKS